MNTTIVTTTIHVPTLLDRYATDAHEHGHRDVAFVVVGDLKTPGETRELCVRLGQKHPYDMTYLGVGEQKRYLKSYRTLARTIPYNSIARRNIGILWAYEHGADTIITIDDDNYIAQPDFVGGHSIVGSATGIERFSASDGWFNICEFLEEERGIPFYARGFPPKARIEGSHTVSRRTASGTVVVNGGLWLEEPDVDATTRLTVALRVVGYPRGDRFALEPGTWCPFNSQNTSLARTVIPAYFLSPHVGRYDDIWASYVVQTIATRMSHLITFGPPLVKQERNVHDIVVDLEGEFQGLRLTDRFTDFLRSTSLSGESYTACYGEIYEQMLAWIDGGANSSEADLRLFRKYASGMNAWMETIDAVGR